MVISVNRPIVSAAEAPIESVSISLAPLLRHLLHRFRPNLPISIPQPAISRLHPIHARTNKLSQLVKHRSRLQSPPGQDKMPDQIHNDNSNEQKADKRQGPLNHHTISLSSLN